MVSPLEPLQRPLLDEEESDRILGVQNEQAQTAAQTMIKRLEDYCSDRRDSADAQESSPQNWQRMPDKARSAPRMLRVNVSDTDAMLQAALGKTSSSENPKPQEFRQYFHSIARPTREKSGEAFDFILDVSYDVQEHYWRMSRWDNEMIQDSPGQGTSTQPPSMPTPMPGKARQTKRQSSDVATVLVILKSFLGGTLLVAPAEFLSAGLLSGNLLFWVVALTEVWCMLKLLQAYRQVGRASFGGLAGKALGVFGSRSVEVSIVLSQFGFIATEMIYVARNGASALRWFLENFSFLRATVGEAPSENAISAALTWLQLVIVVPIGWNRELAALTTYNFVGNLLVFFTTVSLAIMAIGGLLSQGPAEDIDLLCPPKQALVFLGFSVFTFEGINMVIPMYESHRDKATFEKILVGTLVAVTSIFSIFASGNVLLYGWDLQPILTLNLPQNSAAVAWVPLGFSIASLALVPVLALPTFEVVEAGLTRSQNAFSKVIMRNPARVNAFRTLLFIFCAFLARFGGAHLDFFLSLVGAVACVPLAFIYPALIHLRICARSRLDVIGDWFCIVAGAGITVFCTSSSFFPEWFQ